MQLITLIANLRRQTFVLEISHNFLTNIWEYQQIFEQLITLIGNLWRTMLTREFSFFSRKENTIRDGGSTAQCEGRHFREAVKNVLADFVR